MRENLEKLYENKYKDFCKISSMLIGGDSIGAEDVVQEAFARAYRYETSFDPKFGTLEKWFNSILFHCAKSFQKEERMGGMATEIKEGDLVVESDFGHDNKRIEEIEAQVDLLGGINRQICFLYFLRGYKPREIVEILDVPSNTVRTSIKRLAQNIRDNH